MKFVLDQQLTLNGRTRSFEDMASTEGVPLAEAIMRIDSVISIFFADRWLSVTQDGTADWHPLMCEIADPVRAASRFESPRQPETQQKARADRHGLPLSLAYRPDKLTGVGVLAALVIGFQSVHRPVEPAGAL